MLLLLLDLLSKAELRWRDVGSCEQAKGAREHGVAEELPAARAAPIAGETASVGTHKGARRALARRAGSREGSVLAASSASVAGRMADRGAPESLGRDDAIVDEKEREARRSQKRWEAAQSFHRAPCLRPSLAIGGLGGFGIGILRYVGGAGAKAAFTWGGTVAGLLYGTSWYTCRRAMYARLTDEASLMTRMQAGDREALVEYQRTLEAKAKAARPGEGGGPWAKTV